MMKKNSKQAESEKQGIIIILILLVIIALIVYIVISSVKKEKTYEYAVNGEIYKSYKCYQKENGEAYCMKEREIVRVDNYYEVK